MKNLIWTLFFLVGCASNLVSFQKADQGFGYSIENKSTGNFLIKLNLPPQMESKGVTFYTARAVGEECLQQGFEYFDYTAPSNGLSEGFCFKENKRKSLAMTFNMDAFKAVPPKLIIENLNQKSKTYLLVGDQITKAEGRAVQSVSDLKTLSYHYGQKGIMNVELELIRQGKVLKITEPLADLSNGTSGPNELMNLRKKQYFQY